MRSEFVKQLNLSVIIVLVCSVLNTLCKHWILSSIGFCTCGMLWFIHPVKMNDIRSEDACFCWYKNERDNSEIIIFWNPEINRLYIVENII